jgi:ParB family transcriptional regulator, chromosome partitioning protein
MQSKAQQAFEERRRTVLELAGLDPECSYLVRPGYDDYQTVAILAQLLRLTDDEVMQVLAFAMAEALEAGSAVVEATGVKMGVDMSTTWQPDETFLALLAGKDVLHGILSELGGATVADGNKSETTKVQKGIIRDFLTGSNGRSKVENWLPVYARFPVASYTERGGTGCGERWAKVAALFANASA